MAAIPEYGCIVIQSSKINAKNSKKGNQHWTCIGTPFEKYSTAFVPVYLNFNQETDDSGDDMYHVAISIFLDKE